MTIHYEDRKEIKRILDANQAAGEKYLRDWWLAYLNTSQRSNDGSGV